MKVKALSHLTAGKSKFSCLLLFICMALVSTFGMSYPMKARAQVAGTNGIYWGPPYSAQGCGIANSCVGPYATIGEAFAAVENYIATSTNPVYLGCYGYTVLQQEAGGPPTYEENAVAYVELEGPQPDCADIRPGPTGGYGNIFEINGTEMFPLGQGSNTNQSNGSGNPCDGGNGGPGNASGASGGSGDNESDQTGGCPGSPMAGDPINAATGNKFQQETDFRGNHWLTFRRFYNSLTNTSYPMPSTFGNQWRHSFQRSIIFSGGPRNSYNSSMIIAAVVRPDGSAETFESFKAGNWGSAIAGVVPDVLSEQVNVNGQTTSFQLFVGATHEIETYSASGQLESISDQSGQTETLTYSTDTTPTSIAPAPGLLITVSDPMGRALNFIYDASSRITKMTLPDGEAVGYMYDNNNNLVTTTYPGAATRQYVYNESALVGANLPTALTGVIDESDVRLESTVYDSNGLAIESTMGPSGNIDTTKITYNSDGSSTLLTPLGVSTTMTFDKSSGPVGVTDVSQNCGPGCKQPWTSRAFSNGHPYTATDFNGNITTTNFNIYGLLTQKVEGSGSIDQRTTNVNWNIPLQVPTSVTLLNAANTAAAETEFTYNGNGQPTAKCEIDPSIAAAVSYTCGSGTVAPAGVRSWKYTYCTVVNSTQCPLVGLLLSITGPRTDLTQTTNYSYYLTSSSTNCGTPGSACHRAGDLYKVTNALGQVTTVASYDGAGRITRTIDSNGVNTDVTYTLRGWIASRTVGGALTKFTYTPYGAIETITDADGITTNYGYDSAHRLTSIKDASGEMIQYTLDALGNKTGEQIKNSSGTIVQSQTRSYNTLGQLTSIVDGLSQTIFSAGYSDSYDANGNLVHSEDALGVQRELGYDALNRLKSTISNYNGTDTATGNTATTSPLDAQGRIVSVTDPDSLNTLYTYDGLNDQTNVKSPDTGSSTDSFDAAGNRLTHTDAKGIVATSTYDALDRAVATTYSDTTLNVSYKYDEANTVTGCATSSPVGRLTRIVEGGVSTIYCYDARGNVIQKKQVNATTTDTTVYTFTPGDRLSGEISPDHTATVYAYNTNGRISSIKVTPGGNTTAPPMVVSNITWLPFGPISSYTLGNGQAVSRTYDANFRMTDLASTGFTLHLARDAMGNVSAIGTAHGANPATETYHYDPLYRLNAVIEANGSTLASYTYSKTGDRLSKTASGLATGAYLYTTGTHQLKSIASVLQANDVNGNSTGRVIGGNTYGFAYNGRNRLVLAQLGGKTVGSYTYNALGQRIGKVAASTERFAYDEAGHLIGEYGSSNRDYIWLGDLPVAVVDNTISGSVTTSVVNYVVADQLGAPRAVTNAAGTVIWQWAYAGNPFGEQQPTSSAGYVLNLRYPGQYYDAETLTSYNMFRNYEPVTGRYLQSDPIGLAGGISTYTYAANNPLVYIDPQGKIFGFDDAAAVTIVGVGAIVGGLATGITTYEETGSVSEAFESVPAGMVGGGVSAAFLSIEAATLVGTIAYEGLAFTVDAALDAWAVSDASGPLPAPRPNSQTVCP